MEIIVKAKTEKTGNFQIIFEDYEDFKTFILEVLKRLHIAELQKVISDEGSNILYTKINKHYVAQFQRVEDVVFYLEYKEDCVLSDYAQKNTFQLRKKVI